MFSFMFYGDFNLETTSISVSCHVQMPLHIKYKKSPLLNFTLY